MWGGLDPPAELVAALAGSQANPAPATWAGSCCFSGLSRIDKKEPDSATFLEWPTPGAGVGRNPHCWGPCRQLRRRRQCQGDGRPGGPRWGCGERSRSAAYPTITPPLGCAAGEAFLTGTTYDVARGQIANDLGLLPVVAATTLREGTIGRLYPGDTITMKWTGFGGTQCNGEAIGVSLAVKKAPAPRSTRRPIRRFCSTSLTAGRPRASRVRPRARRRATR